MDKLKTNKLLYLEGIRGVAAIMVFLCHLARTFQPDLGELIFFYLKDHTQSHLISHLIHALLNMLLDGPIAVYIFWFMSGYVISIKLFGNKGREYLKNAFSKRYFRLLIPCMGSILLVYILLKTGCMYNVEVAKLIGIKEASWMIDFYNFEPNFLNALKSGLWNTFFNFRWEDSYNVSLWTMQPELYGSLFCFFLFGIFGTIPKRHIAYAIIIIITFFIDSNLVGFLLGFFLCDIDHSDNKLKGINSQLEKKIFSKWYYASLFFCFLILLAGSDVWNLSNILLSSLLVFTVMRSGFLQTIFQSRPLVWLGKISFSLYLLHIPIICSLGCFLYLWLDLPHATKALLSSGITLTVVLLLSVVYAKYIDNFSLKFSNKIAEAFTKKNPTIDTKK
jgi:peptidoglycan/LPS O-acetylase OafA/YrhL